MTPLTPAERPRHPFFSLFRLAAVLLLTGLVAGLMWFTGIDWTVGGLAKLIFILVSGLFTLLLIFGLIAVVRFYK